MKMTENSVLPCTAMLLQRSDSSEGGPEALSGCDRREGHKKAWGTSLVVRWLRLCAPNAGGTVSIPGRGTKIPQAAQSGQRFKFFLILKILKI